MTKSEIIEKLLVPVIPRFKRGKYQVTRWCCSSGTCIECRAEGNRSKRKRVVHTDRVSKEWADHVVRRWTVHGFEPVAELMSEHPSQ